LQGRSKATCLSRRAARLISIYSSINIYCPVDTTGFDKAVKGNRPLGLTTFARMVACWSAIPCLKWTLKMIDGIELGAAATFMEAALNANINRDI